MNLILASQSPRRRELLGLTGLDFIVRVADIDETMDPGKPAAQEVARVSRLKAQAVPHEAEDIVIAADTIGTNGGEFMNATDDITIESASTFIRRQNRACSASEMNTANVINPNSPMPLSRLSFEKSAIEAIVMLKI